MILIGTLRQVIGPFGLSLRWSISAPLLMALASGFVFANTGQAAPSASSAEVLQAANEAPVPLDYSGKTDLELTQLGARWDELSRPERDALLREVKLRMAQRKDPDGVLMIRTQRRYGRIYRSDGRYLKIETKVVRVRPADPNAAPDMAGTQGFGVGFEQRTASADTTDTSESEQRAPDVDGEAPPLVRVNEPSQ